MIARPSGYGVGKAGAPAFDVRGIVEGFYGKPWTHDERLDMIRFIAARGMNTFVYAPKDDSLVRRDWREEYSGPELERIAELIIECESNDIDFVYCLSPGLSIRYSSSEDVAALVSKYESVLALGATRLGLLLDDIPPVLQYPQDIASWPDLASAHVQLVARLRQRFDTLIVCPTQYYGRGNEPYISALGQGLDDDVDLLWTGRLICSPYLDLVDAELFTQYTGHAPLYWDNYPVNDVAMSHELHIGPYRGRDPQLGRASRGVIANGMQFAEASKIAFATIADYLWSPADYDPEASWAVALADVVGNPDDLAAFTMFAENSLTSCLNLDDAIEFSRALERFEFLVDTGNPAEAAAELGEYARRLDAASAHLLSGRVTNTRLIEQARPWLEQFRLGAEALSVMVALAADARLESDASTALASFRDEFVAARRRVFGDSLDMALGDLVDPIHSTNHTVNRHKEAAP